MSQQLDFRDHSRGRDQGRNHGRGQERGVRGRISRLWNDVPQSSDRDIGEGLTATPKPEKVAGKDLSIKDLVYLGSYNWVDSSEPTIVVPGSPPIWLDRPTPYTVSPDTGRRYIDENGDRMPSCPLLPLFHAVDAMSRDNDTTIDWRNIDFITDRNNLRKLLQWLNGSDSDFRIDTQLVGTGTVLMNRWDKRTSEDTGTSVNAVTFGLNFERESTQPVEGSERRGAHYRIVKYNFDGLVLVVRFIVDAQTRSPLVAHAAFSPSGDRHSMSSSNIEAVPQTSVSPSRTDPIPDCKIHVLHGGAWIPQSALVEVTTRSEKYIDHYNWVHTFRQLYFSQTPNHYLGVHDHGTFKRIDKRTLTDPEFAQIERETQGSFSQLRRALQSIKEHVVRYGQDRRLSIVFENGQLQVKERINQDSFLPADIIERFQ